MTISAPDSCNVYTPSALADAITHALGDEPHARWLEPSVGTGVFLNSLSKMGVEPHRIVAIDLDAQTGPQDHLADTLRGQDFIRWGLQTDQMFDRIEGNPPYVPISKLAPPLRDAALSVYTPSSRLVGPKTNYWYAFVCACLPLLNPGGSIGLVLPASWDYADYASELRELMPMLFERFEVHRSLHPLFDAVGEGSIVVLGHGYKRPSKSIKRIEHQNLEAMITALTVTTIEGSTDHLDASEDAFAIKGKTCRLSDIAEIHIGAVTGHAKYFLFNEQQRIDRDLPEECFKPILTRASHLKAGEASAELWQELKHKGERIWLFAPSAKLLDNPNVQAYLDLPKEVGGCNKEAHWVNTRTPWFAVKLPERVDGFISGMSRTGPWICMRTEPNLTVSNTLYTIKFRDKVTQDFKYAWALSMLTSYTHKEMMKACRFYADGLLKYEPKDLNFLKLIVPHNADGAREYYLLTIDLMLKGYLFQARRRADEWFNRQLHILSLSK